LSTLENTTPAVHLSDVGFAFEQGEERVLDIPSWEIARSERVFLQGESGSGKSTLLSLLSGMFVPSSGQVSVLGTAVSSLSTRERDRFRAGNIGFVFQQFNLIPYLSVLDNILLAARFAETTGVSARARAEELLIKVNLGVELHDRPAGQLSIGQQQRVAIVRALINSPELLLVDEPTSALDHRNRDSFLELLTEILSESGCAMVFVSHDPEIGKYFDSKLTMHDLNQAGKAG
tara:strand:- start:131 stop:829 length:699 start_codon:yes stop_codon:yes gene_type:complete